MVYLSFKVVLYWSCTGVVILYFNAFASICRLCGWVVGSFGAGCVPTKEGCRSAPKRGAGGSSGAGCVPTKEGCRSAPERWVVRVVGRDGVLGFSARCVGFAGWKSWKAQSPSRERWVRWIGWSFWLWLVVVALRVGRGQSQKPSHSGTACY